MFQLLFYLYGIIILIFSNVFASQTVVCFPYLGGVVELGVTELVISFPELNSFLSVSSNSCSSFKFSLHLSKSSLSVISKGTGGP